MYLVFKHLSSCSIFWFSTFFQMRLLCLPLHHKCKFDLQWKEQWHASSQSFGNHQWKSIHFPKQEKYFMTNGIIKCTIVITTNDTGPAQWTMCCFHTLESQIDVWWQKEGRPNKLESVAQVSEASMGGSESPCVVHNPNVIAFIHTKCQTIHANVYYKWTL